MQRPPPADQRQRDTSMSNQAREEFQNRHIYFAFDAVIDELVELSSLVETEHVVG